MCGILAVISKEPLNRSFIKESLDSLQRIKHRGPDGEGLMLIDTSTGEKATLRTKDTPASIFCDYQEIADVPEDKFNFLFGHRRLSIIDLSAQGHQPMCHDEVAITYNGEIYNYLELREELKGKGRVFQTNTDTEVIIQAYLEWGENCLNRFNGMWSFVLWDFNKKKFFIANDRFGVKPLYYGKVGENQIFTSEIKQFLDFEEFDHKENKKYIGDYLENGSIQIKLQTPFMAVKRYPNGNYTVIKEISGNTKLNFSQYYSIYNIKKIKLAKDDAIQTFRDLFFDAVKLRTRTDVPYGVGLSGGLDSSSVLIGVEAMLKAKNSIEKPKTFSAIFPGEDEDESKHVSDILKVCNAEAHYINPLKEFNKTEFISHIISQELFPTTTSFYAQWKVAQLAQNNGVKVLLVGQGADEVFGGYHAHFYKFMVELLMNLKFKGLKNNIVSFASVKDGNKETLLKNTLFELISLVMNRLGLDKSSKVQKGWYDYNTLTKFLMDEFSTFQLPYFLLSDDRTAMSSSVETRHPFLDYRIVEFGYSLPSMYLIDSGWQKKIIRDAMFELPESIRWRKDKKGFSAPQEKLVKANLDFFSEYENSNLAFRNKVVNIWENNLFN